MPSFHDLLAAADRTMVQAFKNQNSPTVTIHYKSGAASVTVECVTKNPMFEQDFMPGQPPGAAIIILFVRFDQPTTSAVPLTPAAQGDTATYGGVDYDVILADVDREGAHHLRLRKRSQPWNA